MSEAGKYFLNHTGLELDQAITKIENDYKDCSGVTANETDVVQGKIIVTPSGVKTGTLNTQSLYNGGYSDGYTEGMSAVTSNLQEKIATPTTAVQEITPDSGKSGLSKVTINAIPTTTRGNPVLVNNNGVVTATVQQSAGYVEAGTKTATLNLPTNSGGTFTENQTLAVSGKYMVGDITINIPTSPKVLAITTSGTYDNATYHGESFGVITDDGQLALIVYGGTSTSYESICFSAESLPSGVELGKQSFYAYSAITTRLPYVAIFTGITSNINIFLNFSSINSTTDYVTCKVTITT